MLFTDLLARTGHALSAQGLNWLVVLVAGVLAAIPGFLPACRRLWAHPAVAWTGLALVLAVGTWWAWSLVWASDDAYISFRYARHFIHGRGLVFNAGERVEGYTDFLWTVLVSGLMRLGAPAGEGAILLSLAAFLALLFVVWRLAERLSPPGSRTLPVAAALTAASYTMASFATSGLETVLAALFVLGALSAAEARRPVVAGTLAVLAILCHPDHLLFYVGLGGAWALTCRSWRELAHVALRFAAPFVVLFVPYFLWRWHYYGDLMPNTYYAKSGSLAYFSQGGIYLLVTFVTGGLWATLPLAIVGGWRLRRSITGWFAILALPLYLLYVAKIGGDFMLGRLFVPVLPVIFLLVEVGLRTLLLRPMGLANWRNATLAVGLALITSLAALPVRAVNPGEIYYGIADERTFTTLSRFSPLTTSAGGYLVGHTLHAELKQRGLNPKVAIFSIGMAGFYSDLPVYDLRGLTSRDVAHLPLLARGRPGHEKLASPQMILESGSVLSEMGVYPPPYDELGQATLGGFHFAVVRFEPAVVPTLLSRGGVLDYRSYIDGKIPALAAALAAVPAPAAGPAPASQDRARAECDLWHMRTYYFAANDDPVRRRAVASALTPGDEEGAALWDGWLAAARGTTPVGWQKLQQHGAPFFMDQAAWRPAGEALAWRVTSVPANQSPLSGAARRSAFVDSFTLSGGDGSTGALVSAPFVVRGDAVTVDVGGGLAPNEAHVDLRIDGHSVASATGCGAELWGSRLWDVRKYRGQTATLAIVDESGGPWAHLEVDAIDEWKVGATPSPP